MADTGLTIDWRRRVLAPAGRLPVSVRRLIASTWLLGLLVAIATWNVGFSQPSSGLDPSWWGAMYMAAHHGLLYGPDIIFTYGPLAFLREAWLWYGTLAVLGFVYSSALHIALATSLVWALRRWLPAVPATLLAAVMLLSTPSRDVPLALTTVWCLAALAQGPPGFAGRIVSVGGGVLGAVETLIELRSGPVIWGMCLITVVARRDRRRLAPMFVGNAVVAFGIAWFAAGQSTSNLGAFAREALQIVGGYGEAMGTANGSTPTTILKMIVMSAALTAAAVRTSRSRNERFGAGLVVALVVFTLYKEAIVRADPNHETIFFSTAAVIAGGLFLGRCRVIGTSAILVAGIIAFAAVPAGTPRNLNPFSHVHQTVDQLNLLFGPSKRSQVAFVHAIAMAQHYEVDNATLALVKGHTVQIDPWESAVAWVYRLKWDPLPVFQLYSAYTSQLDRLDANALTSAHGPQMILRENVAVVDHQAAAIDGRLPAWDPPATMLATLCNYAPLHTTQRWELLGRVANRCGRARTVASIQTHFGAVTSVPAAPPGGVLFVDVHGAAVSGVERVRTLLYRAKFRYAIVNGSARYRLVPGTASDGLLLDVPPSLDYPGPYHLSPNVRTMQLTGTSGPLLLDFEWMPFH